MGKNKFEVGFVFGAKKAATFDKTLTGMEKAIGGLGKTISGITKAAAGIAVGFVGISAIKDAAQTYGEFEQSMANVKALSGASGETFAAMEAKALEMGKKTSKTAKEAADALGYMSLAGWDANTSMQALEPVLQLSEAGGLDLARASGLVTDSMSALGIKSAQLPEFLDKVAQTSRKSNTAIDQMAEAFIAAGGALKSMPLEESSAALGVLANRGMTGATAGNSISSLMGNFKVKSGQAYKALSQLGVSAYDVQGNFKGIQATMIGLNDATKDMTQQQRDMYFTMIGGKEQVETLNKLMEGLNTVNAEGVSEFDALKSAIAGSDGALSEMAGVMNDTLPRAIARAKSAMDDLKINAFKRLEPYVTPVINWFSEKLPIATDKFCDGLDRVFGYVDQMKTTFQTLGFSGAIEQMFGGNAGALAKKAEECGKVVIGGFQKAMSGDVKGAAIDIGGLLGFEPETVETAFSAISGAAEIIGTKLQAAFEFAKPAISWVISKGLPGAISLVQGIAEKVIQFGGFVVDNWSTIEPIIIGIGLAFLLWKLPDVIGAGTDMLLNFGSAVMGLPGGISKATGAQIKHIKSLVLDKIETVKLAGMYAKSFALSLWTNAKAVGASTKAWIINKAQLVGQKVATLALKGVQLISTGVTAAMTAAQWALNAAFIASPIGWIVLGIIALIAIGVLLWKNWDVVKAKALELWDGMKQAFGQAVSWFQGVWSGVTTAFDNFMLGLSAKCPMLADIIMVPINAIKGYFDGLKRTFSGIIAFVSGVFTGDWEKAWNGVKDIFGGIFDSFASMATMPINAVIAVINGAIRGINGINVEVPDWVPGMGGETFGFAIPEIPALAKGGVVTSPTLAMIGEGNESEAVLPLSKLRGMLQPDSSFAHAQAGNVGGNASGFMQVLQGLLASISGRKSDGDTTVTFAPNVMVTVEGDGNPEQIEAAVQRALLDCKEEFRRMWEEMQWEKERTAFAH